VPSYSTSVEIQAPPSTVWAVTIDIEAWPSWSPTMDEVTRQDPGPLEVGSAAVIRQPGLRRATWVVDELDPERTFVWYTAQPGLRLIATHRLSPTGTGTAVELEAEMHGVMSRLLWPAARRTVRDFLDQEAAALKVRCEQ